MPILSVWVISKSGGLVYQRDFSQPVPASVNAGADDGKASGSLVAPVPTGGVQHPKLSVNDYLVMASTFQSMHAIAAQLSPHQTARKSLRPSSTALRHALCSGLETIEWTSSRGNEPSSNQLPFKMHCFQSPTGVKFILTATPHQPQLEYILGRVYELYADYCLKSPFQAPEMPIRAERFEHALLKLVTQFSTQTF